MQQKCVSNNLYKFPQKEHKFVAICANFAIIQIEICAFQVHNSAMKKPTIKHLLIACFLFVAMQILCRANIAEYISPFGFAFAFALCYNGVFPVLTSIELFGALAIQSFTIPNLICSASFSAVLFIFWLVQKIFKTKKQYVCLLFCAFSCTANIYFSLSSTFLVVAGVANMACGVLVCYLFSKLISSVLARGVQGLSKNDIICLCFFAMAVGSGLCNLSLFNFQIDKLISMLLIMALALTIQEKSVVLSFSYCVGILITNLNINLVIPYLLIICAAQAIRNKFLLAGAACFIDGAIIYLTNPSFIFILPTIIAACIIVAVPQKLYAKLGTYILGSNISAISSFLLTNKQFDLKNKLMTMSIMFDEMQNCYRDMVMSGNNTQKTYKFVAEEIKNEMCAHCINYMRCYDGKDMTGDFEFLVEKATEKGKITFLDAPNLLASNCTKLNSCISQINQQAQNIIQEQTNQEQANEEKMLSSVQYGAISNIFKELSLQFSAKNVVNAKKSSAIKEKATEFGLVCKECLCFENEQGLHAIYLTLRGIDGVNPLVIDACQSQYAMPLARDICKPTKYSGWSIAKIVPAQKYEVICGIASKPKTAESPNGDNYVFSKISSDKYLVAIADGMGSGANANKISETAIKLIESYYKCGFNDLMVATNINNMLLPATNNFSALDIAIINTQNCIINFIKLGSSISIIKKRNQTYVVEVESLPAGTNELTNPNFDMIKCDAGDIVVMASDGVVDNFGVDGLCDYVANENAINMQIFAESILEEALARGNSAQDDMTVVAYKIAKLR